MSDLIDRQAAIDALVAEARTVDSHYLESERIIHESDAVEVISMLPSAQSKTGRWLRYDIDGEPNEVDTFHWQCDQCLCTEHGRRSIPWRFCPNCGAKMGG